MERILFVPDTHAPFHDERAWALMMQAAAGFKPDVICCIGDLGDFYAISRHSKDPRRALDLDKELEVVNGLLDGLDNLQAGRKIFCEGNHEFRLGAYLQNRAPELRQVISLDGLLRLESRGWECVAYRSFGQIGKLHVTHDVNATGRYAAHKALDTFQGSVVTGHTHRLGMVVEGNAKGERMVSAQFGWLGDVRSVDYMNQIAALRYWTLGFGIGHMDEKGVVTLQPVPMVKYKCVVDGVQYAG